MMVLNKIILTRHDTAKMLYKDRDHRKFILLTKLSRTLYALLAKG